MVTGDELRAARAASGLTQQQAADRLGVSQPYLALLESGRRPITTRLATKLAALYHLRPVLLPLTAPGAASADSSSLAAALANLGYAGFPRPARVRPRNPASILLAAILSPNLEVRVVEALPWLALQYYDLDWTWLIGEAKLRDAQNRLGFVVTLARQLAETRDLILAAGSLRHAETVLDRARLVREDTLSQESLSDAERQWLRGSRPAEARHWNLLTDLQSSSLPYAA